MNEEFYYENKIHFLILKLWSKINVIRNHTEYTWFPVSNYISEKRQVSAIK